VVDPRKRMAGAARRRLHLNVPLDVGDRTGTKLGRGALEWPFRARLGKRGAIAGFRKAAMNSGGMTSLAARARIKSSAVHRVDVIKKRRASIGHSGSLLIARADSGSGSGTDLDGKARDVSLTTSNNPPSAAKKSDPLNRRAIAPRISPAAASVIVRVVGAASRAAGLAVAGQRHGRRKAARAIRRLPCPAACRGYSHSGGSAYRRAGPGRHGWYSGMPVAGMLRRGAPIFARCRYPAVRPQPRSYSQYPVRDNRSRHTRHRA